MKKDFTGYVLAGGRSARMGRDKAALEYGGARLLDSALARLEAVCGAVAIVARSGQTIAADAPVVRDLHAGRGAPGGLHAALEDCATRFAFVTAVDLPLVTPAALGRIAALAEEDAAAAAIVPVQTDGRPQPLCAVYRVAACLETVRRLLAAGPRASMRDLLAEIAVRYVPESELAPGEDIFFNVNRPEDFARLAPPAAEE